VQHRYERPKVESPADEKPFIEMDGQPEESEQVFGYENIQPVSHVAGEKTVLYKIKGGSEKVPGFRGTHSSGYQFLFGAAKKVVQPDRVLLSFSPGPVGRQVNRNTVIVPDLHEFPELVFQDKIHIRPPSCQLEMVILFWFEN
jgi:hypothetical protein